MHKIVPLNIALILSTHSNPKITQLSSYQISGNPGAWKETVVGPYSFLK